MAKQIIESTRQYLTTTAISKEDIGTFVATGTGTGQVAGNETDFPVRATAPGNGATPSALAGVLLEFTSQGCRVGTKGVFKVRKIGTLTPTIGHGVATVNANGEILTTTATGHGEIKLVVGNDVYIDINLPV